jgi:peptidylprolyl isomerase
MNVSRIVFAFALLAPLVAAGCYQGDPTPSSTPTPEGPAAVASDGDTVAVHYRGTLDDGEEFDSSRPGGPITFVVGGGQMISGFDEAVHGLAVGEIVTVRLGSGQAYGEHTDDLVFEVPSEQAPEGLTPGARVPLNNGASGVVLEVTDEFIKIDANHPLAGQTLTFKIEVISIR